VATEPPFETITCPYCGAAVIAAFPPASGWPRTAVTRCPACARRLVVERVATNRFRSRKHRGLLEGLLRL
jgi:DNA-directed RNA polymerase subunit RPC12/RpoP